MKPIFLPPGVQGLLAQRFGFCPREASADIAAEVDRLWSIRNQADESALESIDAQFRMLGTLAALDQRIGVTL